MNNDLVLRLGLVFGATLLALGTAMFLRRGRAVRRHRIQLDDLPAGLYLFTSRACSTCQRMRERLSGRAVVEIEYEAGDGTFPATVKRVPAVASIADDGAGWIAYGAVSTARLDRWLADGP
ncbi:MAG: hypothetical protein ACLGHX_11670 [Acidimicrobiia bacterium]